MVNPEIAQIEKIDDLESDLAHEIATNDKLNDLNISLKQQIDELQQRMKVTVLPSTVKRLSESIRIEEIRNIRLGAALRKAISLIPSSPDLTNELIHLHKIHLDNA